MGPKTFTREIRGKTITVKTGHLAEQANGSCSVQCGDTVVFVSATASDEPREGIDFFPLSVEFEERLYAVGRIPGGFIKREGRPTDQAILTCRLIDRPIRPLFPEGYRNDVQIVVMPLSVDPEYAPDIFAMLGASISLSISDIPFQGPIGSVAIGLIDDEFVVNPTTKEMDKSRLNLVVSGTKDAVMMVEASADEVDEEQMLDAIMFAHEAIKEFIDFQEEIIGLVGKEKKEFIPEMASKELENKIRDYATDMVIEAFDEFNRQKRHANMDRVKEQVLEHFAVEYPEQESYIEEIIENISQEVVRSKIVKEGIRPDGRGPTDIRELRSEVNVLPRTHGSGVFTRGQTQVLTTCTLSALGDVQVLDGLWEDEFKRYIHHYNFPPFSVGETRPMRGPGRREIGHGALAEKALIPVIPSEKDFPYAIRMVSEVMSSNGSSSQASVCGSTLALMDAGVPIKAPVAGIAMGLIKDDETGQMAILSDIQGLEDFYGDMDFKVAGTRDGITAIQMDIKIKGIDKAVLHKALIQAYTGRNYILDKMLEVISKPRTELSIYAPKIIQTVIDPDKIRDVIGPGGKVINGIIDKTGVKIDIEDDGRVFISSADIDAANEALDIVKNLTKEIEVGEIYKGKVVRTVNFGAFVEIAPGKDGLVHISQLARERIDKVEDVVNVGDEIEVKVIEIEEPDRIRLSRKVLLPPTEDEKSKRQYNSKPPAKGRQYNRSSRNNPRRDNR
ncbi:MAG: polyribonucleotide nucleotidyltransferase [Clostridiales bacterium]|nr:polyribonucleotide nucleotidyltransferase [Clostridiales bacterium]